MHKMDALEGEKQTKKKKQVRYLVWLKRDLYTFRLANPEDRVLIRTQMISMIIDDVSQLSYIPEGNWGPPLGHLHWVACEGWSPLVIGGSPILMRSMELPREGTDEWLMREQRQLWEEPLESEDTLADKGEVDKTDVLLPEEISLIQRASRATWRWVTGAFHSKAQKGDQ